MGLLKYIRIASIVLIVGMVVFFYVPFNLSPPDSTRVILDHDQKTYIAPPCFNQADATNFLEETTVAKLDELDYEANSFCTEEALTEKRTTLFHRMTGATAFEW
ncbi:hypothetical protein [Rossellomorea arthrocnemi]|uniref:hypothetical protein n=1 Tax=Rossellomorea arthrocnemi TaxID=2769542 RepID=UPI0019183EA1|nr:hypothetical protein [Rossellomorea arthrocnemi]